MFEHRPTTARQPIYADESIHDRAGFILTALVFPCGLIDGAVDAALMRAGLTPGAEEFKSSSPMQGNEKLRLLRADLMEILIVQQCKVALVISGRSERPHVATQGIRLIGEMAERGRFDGRPVDLFLDEGLGVDGATIEWHSDARLANSQCYTGQDSRIVRGLQLADMAAHCAATVLLSDLGIVKKSMPAGPDSPFEPEDLIDLEYELWTSLRECLPSDELAFPEWDREPNPFREFDAFGLFVSDGCPPRVKAAALRRFGAIYMGCII